jgi:hypothetical protein
MAGSRRLRLVDIRGHEAPNLGGDGDSPYHRWSCMAGIVALAWGKPQYKGWRAGRGCDKSFGSAYAERRASAAQLGVLLVRSSLRRSPCLPNLPCWRTPCCNNYADVSSDGVTTWPPPSTRHPPVRSSMPARRRSATSWPTSDRPPIRPPSNSVPTPRKRLFPPPLHPQTATPLQNKGPDERTILTINGRISLSRRRYAAAGVGSSYPLDAWLDRAEDSLSLGLRERACRLNLASRNFDKAAENLGRAAQVFLSGEFLRQVVESEGRAVGAAAQRGALPLDWTARDCPALDKDGEPTERSRIYLGSDGVLVPHVTDAEKRTRRERIKIRRRGCGRKRRPLPRAKVGADGPADRQRADGVPVHGDDATGRRNSASPPDSRKICHTLASLPHLRWSAGPARPPRGKVDSRKNHSRPIPSSSASLHCPFACASA